MTFITPIPTGRVGNYQVRERLMTQLAQDQLALFRAQTQVSTGRRLLIPSDDAPAAVRGITLQRILEQKDQIQINLQTSVSYLAATDSSLSSVSNMLAGIRGSALGVVSTTTTDEQRRAVAVEVEQALQVLVDTGNQTFRGRSLFVGSRTHTTAYEFSGKYVRYLGNERRIQSFSDVDVLSDTNLHGVEVFGGISDPVRTTVDLNPHLTPGTLLSTLHGGAGVGPRGAIRVSDGTNTSTVDLSGAVTVEDVARLIEAAPPPTRTVRVDVTGQGLVLSLDTAGGGNLTVTEVDGGTTAFDLRIVNDVGVLTGPLVGGDLNPALLPTTPLANLLGTKAVAQFVMPGTNNDLLIEASQNGTAYSGVAIQLVDDNLLQASLGVSAGNEYAQFDTAARSARASLALSGVGNDLVLTASTPGTDFNNVQIELVNAGNVQNAPTVNYVDNGTTRTLTLGIDDTNETTVGDLIAAINASGEFTASFDPSAGEVFNSTAPVFTADAGVRTGNTGNSGGNANTLYIFVEAGASTAQLVADAINAEGTFIAQVDGRDAVPLVPLGTGLVDLTATATTTGGSGTPLDTLWGLQITNGGQTHGIDLSTAVTVEDLLNELNGSDADVLAQINAARNGIDIRSRLSGADFAIGENGGQTATQLGLRTLTDQTRLETLGRGIGVPSHAGTDFFIVADNGTQLDIDVSTATTIGDVIDLINNHPLNNTGTTAITARLAQFGNGIELVDADATGTNVIEVRTDNFSLAAEYLGLVAPDQTTSATALTSGFADLTNSNADLTITAATVGTQFNGVSVVITNSGTVVGDAASVAYDSGTNTLTIDVDPAATRAITVRDAINLDGTFTAALNTDQGPNDGSGLVVDTGTVVTLAGGTPPELTGRDVNPIETDSAFNTLVRLRDALEAGDIEEIQRTIGLIENDILRLNFARAGNGARHQSLELMQTRIEDEKVELSRSLSLEIDVDLARAISDMTARQASLTASLQTSASLLTLSLLDFI